MHLFYKLHNGSNKIKKKINLIPTFPFNNHSAFIVQQKNLLKKQTWHICQSPARNLIKREFCSLRLFIFFFSDLKSYFIFCKQILFYFFILWYFYEINSMGFFCEFFIHLLLLYCVWLKGKMNIMKKMQILPNSA